MPPMFRVPLLGVGWVLNYEIYFYACFGLAMLFGRWRWLAFPAWVLIALIVIPVAAGNVITWSTLLSPYVSYGFKYDSINLFTNPMIWLFVGGIGISFAYHSSLTINNTFYVRIFLSGAVAFTIWQYTSFFRPALGILNWGLSLIPLVLILSVASKTINLAIPRWLVYLGDISFPFIFFTLRSKKDLTRSCAFWGIKPFRVVIQQYF